VGSVVSFVDGVPHRSGYRNYRIRAVKGIDDYGMMAELVSRRISKGQLPDLFLVDGGKGHLSAVERVLDREQNPDAPEVVSIAKPDEIRQERWDKIYIPGRKNPLGLRGDHPVLLLLMRIRDEAHRRAITYHRRLRGRNLIESELDCVPGIGPKRKKLLLTHFKDIKAISTASVEELTGVPGINRPLAENVFSFFQDKEV
jgi:excinuclease ABC subunit C